jgi:chitinase
VSLPLVGVKVIDVKGWAAAITPNDCIFEIFGSYSYRIGMSLLNANMNLIKMRIFIGHRIIGVDVWDQWIKEAADGKLHRAKMILGNIQKVYMPIWSSSIKLGADRYRLLLYGTT